MSDRQGNPRVLSEQEIEELVQRHGGLVMVIDGRWRYHVDGCPTLSDQDVEEGDVLEIREEGFTVCPRCTPDRVLAEAALAASPRPAPPAEPPAPRAPTADRKGSVAIAGAGLVDQLGRVHHRQRSWAGWLRALWWLLLLPLALACSAALQTSRPKQLVGWALAAVVLLAYGVGLFGPTSNSSQEAAELRRAAPPLPVVTSPAPEAAGSTPARGRCRSLRGEQRQ